MQENKMKYQILKEIMSKNKEKLKKLLITSVKRNCYKRFKNIIIKERKKYFAQKVNKQKNNVKIK